jgi:predicted histone-like DNA-binding protein
MAIFFTASGKTNPNQKQAPMLYYPRAVQSEEIDLDELSQQISFSTTLTETDCQAVIYSLVNTVSQALEQGKIVRLGHLGTFQISIKGTPSENPEDVIAAKIESASIIYRPGKRFKTMLKNLKFAKKK